VRPRAIGEDPRVLDRLRRVFPYAVAVLLPLAGIVIALVHHTQDDREEALRIALAAFLGLCAYGLLLR
jgi:hypothetical protein